MTKKVWRFTIILIRSLRKSKIWYGLFNQREASLQRLFLVLVNHKNERFLNIWPKRIGAIWKTSSCRNRRDFINGSKCLFFQITYDILQMNIEMARAYSSLTTSGPTPLPPTCLRLDGCMVGYICRMDVREGLWLIWIIWTTWESLLGDLPELLFGLELEIYRIVFCKHFGTASQFEVDLVWLAFALQDSHDCIDSHIRCDLQMLLQLSSRYGLWMISYIHYARPRYTIKFSKFVSVVPTQHKFIDSRNF